jgi:hypothetical protein
MVRQRSAEEHEVTSHVGVLHISSAPTPPEAVLSRTAVSAVLIITYVADDNLLSSTHAYSSAGWISQRLIVVNMWPAVKRFDWPCHPWPRWLPRPHLPSNTESHLYVRCHKPTILLHIVQCTVHHSVLIEEDTALTSMRTSEG